ncbi:DnaJ-domain-containing protein [Auriscalpium vulgare]|uniref:DnaJ-domain-containing protein n=1 Tax=Auriscalpium vulgare TaxID=40419 RepID=A0ACB8SCF8_9AGAM|nr:DnaJ-domain-containing protein [Auriscalpium vulgare]
MRLLFLFAFVALLATLAHAWEKEDHEIFDLVSALEAAEGKGTTFYSWIDVPPTATTAEIARAYRKKSMVLHPDKNPGVKGIQERFARLGVISAILRNAEGRKRYDFFYKNGVPRWRGTGYYYERFRPGLGAVLVFLTILTSGLHYIIQRMNYKRDLARIEHIIQQAKLTAWGPKLVPAESRRKVKVNLGGPPRYDAEGEVINGKSIDMVVESNGEVFILADGDLIPINTSTAPPPAISKTWFLALLSSLFGRFVPRKASASDADGEDAGTGEDGETGTDSDMPELEYPELNGNGSGELKGRPVAVKTAGGRRRKVTKRR